MLAKEVGKLFDGCKFVAVPFAGGMCELPCIKANVLLVGDLHRHVINLARAIKEDAKGLADMLDVPFHPDVLEEAQLKCLEYEDAIPGNKPNLDLARYYFICVWMTRSGAAGTDGEFTAGLSVRWKSGGGDSVVRFRNAAHALAEWHKTMRRCTFVCMDAFQMLVELKAEGRDIEESGLYIDAPWVVKGDKYVHSFHEQHHRDLAHSLLSFKNLRIVVRYGDHPLVRELYPEAYWDWKKMNGRTQTNNDSNEVLIVRKR